MSRGDRRVLVLAHTGRPTAVRAAEATATGEGEGAAKAKRGRKRKGDDEGTPGLPGVG